MAERTRPGSAVEYVLRMELEAEQAAKREQDPEWVKALASVVAVLFVACIGVFGVVILLGLLGAVLGGIAR